MPTPATLFQKPQTPSGLRRLAPLALLLLTACNASTGGDETGVRGAGGVDIHYSVTGSGETSLVFVHGWSCDSSYWSEQLDAFADRYEVITLDLAGHGQSGSNREDWSIEAFGGDVAAVVDAAASGPVVLVGHSMGGPVVLEAARRLGERVQLIVAVDTLQTPGQAAYSEEESRKLWAPFADNFAVATEGFVRQSFFLPDSPTELVDRISADMAAADPYIALEAGHGLTTYSVADGLKAVAETPLVLINADYVPTDTETLQSLHSKSRLELMEGVGHFPMLETPDTFNSLLDSVLLAELR